MLSHRFGKMEDLGRIYESYAYEFPVEERKSLDQLRVLMSGGKYHLIIFEDKGFACVYADLNALNQNKKAFIWLDYLVIHRAYQGQGYGSIFFNQLLDMFHQASYMFIEVEIPDGVDVNRDRRIRYYEKLGSKRLPLNYALPIEKGALPMYLYIKHRDTAPEGDESSQKDKASEPVYDAVFDAIHEVFHYVHHDHPKIRHIFDVIQRQSPNFEDELHEIFI